MSRSTLVKYKGETIADLKRTINPNFFCGRLENLTTEQLSLSVTENEEDLKRTLLKTIVALAAHHPTKKELDETLTYLDAFVDGLADSFEELGMATLLVILSEEDEISIELE